MTFYKTARVESLGSLESTDDGLTKIATGDPALRDSARSYYIDGARKLDIVALLKEAAEKFDISADPSDYIFEAIRANTVNVPNENHDAFHRDELLRYDAKLRKAVYLTYQGKPHHLNHQVADPKRARGVVLDAHYNDDSPAQDNCEYCGYRTAEATNRDPSGIHCARCAHVVKDEFVEILVAVDTKKDPTLARGVRSGALNAGSMGASCASTSCNVCDHVAHTVSEFCEHIRGAAKGSLWQRQGTKFTRVDADTVRRTLRKAGYKVSPTASGSALCAVTLVVPDADFEVRRAHEWCQGVEYQEYSRVHRPADPKALTIELLKAAGLPEDAATSQKLSLEQESELLIIKARLQEIEKKMTIKTNGAGKTASAQPSSFYVVRVNGNDEDLHVATSLAAAIKQAALGRRDVAEYTEVAAASETTALIRAAKTAQYLPVEGDVQMVIPDGVQVQLKDMNGQLVGPDGMPQPGQPGMGQPGADAVTPNKPQSIEDVQQTNQQEGPGQPGKVSPEEWGMLPPGASAATGRPQAKAPPMGQQAGEDMQHDEGVDCEPAERFASIYGDLEIEVFGDRAVLSEPAGDIFSVKTAALASDEDKYNFGRKLLDNVLEHGLVRTAIAYDAEFAHRVADITEGAMFDTAEKRPNLNTGVLDQYEDDMAGVERDSSTESVLNQHTDDMAGVERKVPESAISDRDTDMEDEAKVQDAKSATDDAKDDMEEPREPYSVSSDDALEGYSNDMSKSAEATETRMRKLYAARLEKGLADAKTELLQKFTRALKLAHRRQTLNLEESPLKLTLVDSLTVPRVVGKSAASGEPLQWRGLDDALALHLVEAAWQQSAGDEIDGLVRRAAEIMNYDEDYLLTAESDLGKQAAYLPQVTVMDAEEEIEGKAALMRQAALQGNLDLAPRPTDSGVAFDRVSLIRDALSNTSVSQTLKGLWPSN